MSRLEEQRLLARMKPEEGRRYNAYVDRWRVLHENVRTLLHLAGEVKTKLLERDRVLWYWRGVLDVEEALVFQHGKALLEQNANVQPGKPLEVRTVVGTIRLGVAGKKRLPFGVDLGGTMNPRMEEVLDLFAASVRRLASEVKALASYVVEEAEAMKLVTMTPLVRSALGELREYDRPLLREVLEGAKAKLPPGALLPVEERWALVWEEVEEDRGTELRVRLDPENWEPLSVDRLLAGRSWGELWQEMAAEEA